MVDPGERNDLATADGERFEITASRSKLARSMALLVAFMALSLVNLLWLGNTVVGVAGLVVFGLIVAIGVPALARRRTVLLTLGPDGVTPAKGTPMPWADLRELRLTILRPRFLWLIGRRAMQVLVFVPRDVERALATGAGRRLAAGRLAARLYGGPVMVQRGVVDQSFDDITATVRRHVDVPVRDDR